MSFEYNVHGHPMKLNADGSWAVGAEAPMGVDCPIIWDQYTRNIPNKNLATYFSFNEDGVCGLDGTTESLPFVLKDPKWEPGY